MSSKNFNPKMFVPEFPKTEEIPEPVPFKRIPPGYDMRGLRKQIETLTDQLESRSNSQLVLYQQNIQYRQYLHDLMNSTQQNSDFMREKMVKLRDELRDCQEERKQLVGEVGELLKRKGELEELLGDHQEVRRRLMESEKLREEFEGRLEEVSKRGEELEEEVIEKTQILEELQEEFNRIMEERRGEVLLRRGERFFNEQIYFKRFFFRLFVFKMKQRMGRKEEHLHSLQLAHTFMKRKYLRHWRWMSSLSAKAKEFYVQRTSKRSLKRVFGSWKALACEHKMKKFMENVVILKLYFKRWMKRTREDKQNEVLEERSHLVIQRRSKRRAFVAWRREFEISREEREEKEIKLKILAVDGWKKSTIQAARRDEWATQQITLVKKRIAFQSLLFFKRVSRFRSYSMKKRTIQSLFKNMLARQREKEMICKADRRWIHNTNRKFINQLKVRTVFHMKERKLCEVGEDHRELHVLQNGFGNLALFTYDKKVKRKAALLFLMAGNKLLAKEMLKRWRDEVRMERKAQNSFASTHIRRYMYVWKERTRKKKEVGRMIKRAERYHTSKTLKSTFKSWKDNLRRERVSNALFEQVSLKRLKNEKRRVFSWWKIRMIQAMRSRFVISSSSLSRHQLELQELKTTLKLKEDEKKSSENKYNILCGSLQSLNQSLSSHQHEMYLLSHDASPSSTHTSGRREEKDLSSDDLAARKGMLEREVVSLERQVGELREEEGRIVERSTNSRQTLSKAQMYLNQLVEEEGELREELERTKQETVSRRNAHVSQCHSYEGEVASLIRESKDIMENNNLKALEIESLERDREGMNRSLSEVYGEIDHLQSSFSSSQSILGSQQGREESTLSSIENEISLVDGRVSKWKEVEKAKRERIERLQRRVSQLKG